MEKERHRDSGTIAGRQTEIERKSEREIERELERARERGRKRQTHSGREEETQR